MNSYQAAALPPELWPGNQERWGVLAPDGKWLREAPSGRPYSFVTPVLAAQYAALCNRERGLLVAEEPPAGHL
jgi:hypothetical protein